MNYLAHGRHFTRDPYYLAGTATPDWLSVIDRKCRAREKLAAPYVDDPDPRRASVAQGVVQHHRDDAWFHQTRAFNELCLQLTVLVRDALPPDASLRPSFLGHILVELLLDAELARRTPSLLDDYYDALAQLDPHVFAAALAPMLTRPTDRLPLLIPRFIRERFLDDYADDDKLRLRLNAVLRRVGLCELPTDFSPVLAQARSAVVPRATELLNEQAALVAMEETP